MAHGKLKSYRSLSTTNAFAQSEHTMYSIYAMKQMNETPQDTRFASAFHGINTLHSVLEVSQFIEWDI